jgi:hypothetical protein
MSIDESWVQAAVRAVEPDQLVAAAQVPVSEPVARIDSLFRSWAVGFAAQRTDVETAEFLIGSRGWHADECAALLRGLDARRLHVDSSGYAWPLCAQPKPGQGRYALCCKSGRGVSVNQEYMIQLGAVAELNELYGWPSERLRVELGEFDAAALDHSGASALLMEAKCRAAGPTPSADTLEKLLRSWIGFARGGAPIRGTNAANKYLYLRDRAADGPVTVLLVGQARGGGCARHAEMTLSSSKRRAPRCTDPFAWLPRSGACEPHRSTQQLTASAPITAFEVYVSRDSFRPPGSDTAAPALIDGTVQSGVSGPSNPALNYLPCAWPRQSKRTDGLS